MSTVSVTATIGRSKRKRQKITGHFFRLNETEEEKSRRLADELTDELEAMLALPTDGTDMLPSYPAIPKRAATPPISPTPTPVPLVSKPRRSFSIAVHPDHQKLLNLSADSEAWKKYLSEVAMSTVRLW